MVKLAFQQKVREIQRKRKFRNNTFLRSEFNFDDRFGILVKFYVRRYKQLFFLLFLKKIRKFWIIFGSFSDHFFLKQQKKKLFIYSNVKFYEVSKSVFKIKFGSQESGFSEFLLPLYFSYFLLKSEIHHFGRRPLKIGEKKFLQ